MFGMVHFGSLFTSVPTEQQEITTDYKKLLTWNTEGPKDFSVDPDSQDGTITLTRKGMYNVVFTASFKGTNERQYDLALFNNGVLVPQIKLERFYQTNLLTGDVYFGGLLSVVTVPAILDVRIKCDKDIANVAIVENATLSCIELPTDISSKVTKSADQTIPNSTSTIITWDQEDYDTDGMHDNVTNPSRITIKTAGKYSIMAQFEWASNSTGKRIIDIVKNSVVSGKANYLASGNSQHTISFVDAFAVDDILEVRVFQDSGGNLDFLNNITYFEAHIIY